MAAITAVHATQQEGRMQGFMVWAVLRMSWLFQLSLA
jgi:hypothetical protein